MQCKTKAYEVQCRAKYTTTVPQIVNLAALMQYLPDPPPQTPMKVTRVLLHPEANPNWLSMGVQGPGVVSQTHAALQYLQGHALGHLLLRSALAIIQTKCLGPFHQGWFLCPLEVIVKDLEVVVKLGCWFDLVEYL